MLVEVVLFLLLVCLTAGLQKMYWPVVHETWWKDVARAKEVTLKGVDLKLSEGYIYDVPLLQHCDIANIWVKRGNTRAQLQYSCE